MANDSYYNKDDNGIWFSQKESAFRTNALGKDTANAADTAFYRMMGRLTSIPLTQLMINKRYYPVANIGRDVGAIDDTGYGEGKLTLSSDMIDLSMFMMFFGACTTTDDTPSAGKYTHVYINTTAQAKVSFQLLYKMHNLESGNNIILLYTGCVLNSFSISADVDGNIIGIEYEILFANIITGLALTTFPTFGTLKPYTIDRTEVSFLKIAAAYPGKCRGFKIDFTNNARLNKAANEELPEEILLGDRELSVTLQFAPKDETVYADFIGKDRLAPDAASNINITIKMYRNATNDYTEFALEKCYCVSNPLKAYTMYDRWAEVTDLQFVVKPVAYETGAKWTVTEVNALDDDRYET